MPVQLVEPPVLQRGRATAVDQKELEDFKKLVGKGFASDGKSYPNQKKASYEASKWKRHLASALPGQKFTTRVWDTTGKNVPERGKWVFAISLKKD